MDKNCHYFRQDSDGYRTVWQTACGHRVTCEVPDDVGFAFAPLPNAAGKFCHYCGGRIELPEGTRHG